MKLIAIGLWWVFSCSFVGNVAPAFQQALTPTGPTVEVGRSCSVGSGTLAVGSKGRAWTFSVGEGGTGNEHRLTSNVFGAYTGFGTSIAVSADGKTAVVGAPEYSFAGDEEDGFDAQWLGGLSVFVRKGTDWEERDFDQGLPHSRLGYSVAIDENTIAGGTVGGHVHVYGFDSTTLSLQQMLTPTTASPSDFFGSSISISDNYIAVGAHGHGSNSGAVYIFWNNGTQWTQQAMLTAASTPDYRLGVSVSINGDTVAVGADGFAKMPGKVHVYDRNGTSWIERSTSPIVPANQAAVDQFGFSVSLWQDQQANDLIAVGAPGHQDATSGNERAGLAYVFQSNGSSWVETAFPNPQPALDDFHGTSISGEGTFLAVGTPSKDGATFGNEGVLYHYVLNVSQQK